MLNELMSSFNMQLQLGLMVLILVMGILTLRAHNQVSKLARTSKAMQESLQKLENTTEVVSKLARTSHTMQESLLKLEDSTELVGKLTDMSAVMQGSLARLEQATDEITRRTEETEETLKSNLEEYRMAQGSTNAYREYLQRMGMAPASDVEPILEAIGDGAEAVGLDGRILYTNRAFADITTVEAGSTLEEVARRCQVRAFNGDALALADLPESRVLQGESVHGALIRMRPAGREHDVILSVNGQPARDATGKVVAAVMLCREVSEEIAMAI
ncbi:MAG: PAS domain-containing protein, partial [Actinomycetota bacterium]